MTAMTLRAACIEKTRGLLMSGVWDGCEENPFQCMPASVLQELLSRMMPECSERSIPHFRLLLTSGRLEHVALTPGIDRAQFVPLLEMLCRGCRNLRTLSVIYSCWGDSSVNAERRALREVLRRSTKLELLHSEIPFVPDDLRNCRNLKTVRLHFHEDAVRMFYGGITSALWEGPPESQPLRSVEVLALCQNFCSLDTSTYLKVAMLLDNCPQLTSLGFLDSSAALKALHDTELMTHGTPRRFQLRRCFWGPGMFFWGKDIGKSGYCERIRVAAQSYPLVEVLMMEVLYEGALQHLKPLRNLTSLFIFFVEMEGDSLPDFFSLLPHIGPQLRHLCVLRKSGGSISLNAIGGNCPNLRTLQVENCPVTADEGLSFPHLERLSVFDCEPRSLLPLLSICPRLKVLCMIFAESLEDGNLQPILRKNPFAELEVMLIRLCSLSESGLRRLVQSASRLRSCCLASVFMSCDEVRDVNPSVVCHPPNHFRKLRDEQFPMNMNTSCQL